jgi:hypothetical protein
MADPITRLRRALGIEQSHNVTAKAKPIDPVDAAISKVNPSFALTNGEQPLTVDGVPGAYNIEPVPSPIAGTPACTKISHTPQGKPTKVIAPMVCG